MIYETLNPKAFICFLLHSLLITQKKKKKKKKLSCAKSIDLGKKNTITELKECQHIVEGPPCPHQAPGIMKT